MGFASGVVKYLVFLANLVFALAGLALIIIGVMYKINYSEGTRALPSDFSIAPTLSIIVGAVVFVTAFLGCCGAVRESTCMLTTYAIILLTIFIVQVAIGVYAFLQVKDSDQFKEQLAKALEVTFKEYGKNNEATEATDATQRWLKCCGVRSSFEWNVLNKIPESCCDTPGGICTQLSPSKYTTSCADALYKFVMESAQIVGGVIIGIAVIELVGASFALCLASSIRNSYRRHMYA